MACVSAKGSTGSELFTLFPRKESRLLDMAGTERQVPKDALLLSCLSATISWGDLLEGYVSDGSSQALRCYEIPKLAV